MNDTVDRPKHPWVAALLALFFPGVGHVYTGRFLFGVGVYLAVMGSIFLPLATAAIATAYVAQAVIVAFAVSFGLYAYQIVSAARSAYLQTASTLAGWARSPWPTVAMVLLTPALSVSVGIEAFFHANLSSFVTPSISMFPTLIPGDRFFVVKLGHEASPGQLVAYRVDAERVYVKRVIAVGGDVVEIRDGRISVNGSPIPRRALERTVARPYEPAQPEFDVFQETLVDVTYRVVWDAHAARQASLYGTVPPEHLFVVGDNRDHSEDSRHHGPIPIVNAIGVARAIFFSSGPAGVRWDRLFTDLP